MSTKTTHKSPLTQTTSLPPKSSIHLKTEKSTINTSPFTFTTPSTSSTSSSSKFQMGWEDDGAWDDQSSHGWDDPDDNPPHIPSLSSGDGDFYDPFLSDSSDSKAKQQEKGKEKEKEKEKFPIQEKSKVKQKQEFPIQEKFKEIEHDKTISVKEEILGWDEGGEWNDESPQDGGENESLEGDQWKDEGWDNFEGIKPKLSSKLESAQLKKEQLKKKKSEKDY